MSGMSEVWEDERHLYRVRELITLLHEEESGLLARIERRRKFLGDKAPLLVPNVSETEMRRWLVANGHHCEPTGRLTTGARQAYAAGVSR